MAVHVVLISQVFSDEFGLFIRVMVEESPVGRIPERAWVLNRVSHSTEVDLCGRLS